MNNLETPLWNISSIYPNFESNEFKSDLEKLKTLNQKQEELLNSELINSNFNSWLSSWILIENELGALYESLSAYAEAISTTDTNDTKPISFISLLDEINLSLNNTDRKFLAILSNNESSLPSFLKDFPQFSDYSFIFTERLTHYKHQMSNTEENLAEDLQRTGSDAWSRLQQQIISNLVDEETGKTFIELRNDAYSVDCSLRQESYKKEISLLKSAEIPLAACLNNIKGTTITLNKRRNWNKSIDHSLFSSRLSEKTLSALISSIEKSLPFWREYLQLKASILQTGNSLPFYDLFAPIINNKELPQKTWSFKEASKYIIERYNSFSSDMGDFAKKAFENNWIDASIRRGKVGGAYCISFPAHKESRVLMNFTGTYNDILTLAHELGHAYHHECIKNADYALMQYPMTLAETASIFAETIVMKDMLSKSTGAEQADFCEKHLSDCCQVLVDILCRFYFEKSVFEARQTHELSASDFCSLMIQAQEKTYGSGLSNIKHPYMWALKCHYYISDFDYYNYPYAFGQLFSLGLFAQFQKEGTSFSQKYKQILINTGKKDCQTLCSEAGFNIETEDFWLSGIHQFKNELEILQNFAKEKKLI